MNQRAETLADAIEHTYVPRIAELERDNAELRGKLAATASALTKTKANMEEMERNLYLKLQAQEAEGERLDEAYELAIAELREKLAGMEEALIEKCIEADTMRQLHKNAESLIDTLAAENARLREALDQKV